MELVELRVTNWTSHHHYVILYIILRTVLQTLSIFVTMSRDKSQNQSHTQYSVIQSEHKILRLVVLGLADPGFVSM